MEFWNYQGSRHNKSEENISEMNQPQVMLWSLKI